MDEDSDIMEGPSGDETLISDPDEYPADIDKILSIGVPSTSELARRDKRRCKRFKSPKLAKMYCIKRGKTAYFYHTEERYHKALEKFKEIDQTERPRQKEVAPPKIIPISKGKKCGNCRHLSRDRHKQFICLHKLNTLGTPIRIKLKQTACDEYKQIKQ